MRQRLIDCSRVIVTELPKADIKDVINVQFEKGFPGLQQWLIEKKLWWNEQQIDKVVDEYTIPRGVYGVKTLQGAGVEIVTGLEPKIKGLEEQLKGFKARRAEWKFADGKWSR
jgi:hypothetical protein